MAQNSEGGGIEVRVPEALRAGNYSNNLVVGHTKEEFILDFILIATDEAILTARVITSPGHMKRILGAIAHNVEAYERTFGPIEEPEVEPRGGTESVTRH